MKLQEGLKSVILILSGILLYALFMAVTDKKMDECMKLHCPYISMSINK